MTPRRAVSVARTVLYVGLVILTIWAARSPDSVWKGGILGCVMGDLGTWFIRCLLELPNHIMEGAWDAVVNIAATLIILQLSHFQFPGGSSSVAALWVCFVMVLTLKMLFYSREYLGDFLYRSRH